MQRWRDDAIILTGTRHGEQAMVVHLLTATHGRTAGYLRGASTPRLKPVLQPGNIVQVDWQARLPDQLGYVTLEPVQALAPALMQRVEWALVLQSVAHMLLFALPERHAYPRIFDVTKALLQNLANTPEWGVAYIWWEVHVLAELGFGLRLDKCVQTEQIGDLTHVSPKSGHAVSRFVATPYADRLLKLPAFLGGAESFGDNELPVGLALTGYFLQQYIAQPLNKPLPEARQRLAALLLQQNSTLRVSDEILQRRA